MTQTFNNYESTDKSQFMRCSKINATVS